MTGRVRLLRVAQSPWFHLTLIGLLALPALWPLITQGFPKTHDASLHLIRLHLLDEQVRSGNFFPRWLPDLMTGYGYPLFNFYAPIIYYTAEALHLAGLGQAYAVAAVMGALVILAGWGMYFLAADLYAGPRGPNRWAGLAAAAVYIYTPYLLVNTYVRGAAAELLAQALLPWLFWSVARAFQSSAPGRYVVLTSVLVGAVALGHNITLLLLPAVLGPYVLLLFLAGPGERSARLRRLGWLAAGALIAAALTAFFWLPLIGERGLLAHTAYNAPNLSDHIWTFATFLEPNLPYNYGLSAVPFRLGLVQVILAAAGLLLTRSRTPLWWYWVALGALALAGITPAILPLWNAVELLSIVQFPWRLLSFVALATALLAAGLVTRAPRPRWQAMLAALTAAAAILGGRPLLATYDMSMYADLAIDPAVIARYEAGYGAWGAGWHREFLPESATAFDAAPPVLEAPSGAPERVTLAAVTTHGVELQVESAAPAALRFSQFYFPGWQATLDAGTPAPVYPSAQPGFVTVSLPAGVHTLRLAWGESGLQSAAEWLTLAAAALLTAALAFWPRRRRFALPALAGTLLLALLLKAPFGVQAQPFTPAPVAVLPGLDLLGYQTKIASNGRSLLITPFWYNRRQYEDLDISWRLVDGGGTAVSELSSEPYYGAQSGVRWQPGTVMRDGYRLPLPVGRPAGEYTLEFKVDAQTVKTGWQPLGAVAAPAIPAWQPVEALFTDLQSGEGIALAGYGLAVNDVRQEMTGEPLRVHPGDRVAITLYWRAARALSEDYHSFLHLVSHDRQTLTSLDKIPGQESARPRFWDRAYAEADTYELTIPPHAPSGLYYPRAGLYDADDIDRFIVDVAGGGAGDALDLPPLKVVSRAAEQVAEQVDVAYGDFGRLAGYAIAPATGIIAPGTTLTVTVYYRGVQPASADYTQFFQLYAPALGMAAQSDQPPRQGGNPTTTWMADEIIVDQVVLTVDPAAAPGQYTLNTGMYDPVSGARAPLMAADGSPMPDNQALLAVFTVPE